jgi:hypothetical protein
VSIPEFDAFIAIDWSGAARSYDGIAVARCELGNAAPELVEPRATRWTRQEIAEWLEGQLKSGERLLIGFDFAFGFPFEPAVGYLGGRAPDVDDIFALWDLIETKSCGDPDFGCSNFVNDPALAGLFWTTGPRPTTWIERKRRAERACAEFTTTRPDTLYKLLHSKQVGKASITGMRVLHQVRTRAGNRVAIWPFETIRHSAMVEIYPTIFRQRATHSVAKLKTKSQLDAALEHFGSRSTSLSSRRKLSDHDTDALISAAGLRVVARDHGIWAPRELATARVQREGWIFGVGEGATTQ